MKNPQVIHVQNFVEGVEEKNARCERSFRNDLKVQIMTFIQHTCFQRS